MTNHSDRFMETFASGKPSKLDDLEVKRQQVILEYNQNMLNELLRENSLRPVKVSQVNVLGDNLQFRDRFLARQLQPLLKNPGLLTLKSFLQKVDTTAYNFTKTTAVEQVTSKIDSTALKSPGSSLDTLELVANVKIKPVKKLFMKIGTNVGNGEGDGYLSLQWRNIFGGAETLTFDTNMASNQIGTRNRSQYLLDYSMPILNSPDHKIGILLYHSSRFIDYTTYHEQIVSGVTTKLSTNYLPFENRFNQELTFENLIRTMSLEPSPNGYRNNSLINDYFLFNAGESPKSSVVYSVSHDTRDQPIFPTSGHLFKSTIEYSFLPASTFLKTTLQLLQAFKISNSLSLSMTMKLGFIKGLNNALIHPMDKFQSGGPNDIRGFWTSGIGPKQMGLSIGGDASSSYGLSLFQRIPFLSSDSNFKLHYFLNSGRLINLDTSRTGLFSLFNQLNTTAGFGIVYAHPAARFEFNFTLPIAIHNGDEVRKGIQYGIGLSFL
ncbi:hypothetical protein KL930_000303 [Ogataea haglerorum]|uniref:uncharacterized protein n=1 Tax=Ogataea haglerorum TaxID=1937702 RepID=UPI001C8B0150|nr:uncharacterized protein KL911_000828 [Ogataea haglerorum]KAG7697642.1 hypothetical protein KL951_002216 [Ogataea haglerorum]KAG7741780.1 hypothetical protein KL923_001035 [Ogataea haglerorum]KAG7742384.1 hypothetical protein KL932_002526 [Ogataea haglerorum]KAG7750420.1 hypothetical protein KL912_000980 [Ogataea haglerorum]KAG7757852.1 hypothetical protein KL911_000828 [Ogataea haglerorum]